ARHSAEADAIGRAAVVRVFHDLRPQDDARPPHHAHSLRRVRRRPRLRAAVRTMEARRAHLGAVFRIPAGAAARSRQADRARRAVPLVATDRAMRSRYMGSISRLLAAAASAAALLVPLAPAHAFCGFYVAKADAKLFNKASKVVVARK